MRKKFALLVVWMALLGAAGLVAAQDGSRLPGTGWRTGQQIQNVGEEAGLISFFAYDASGVAYDCGTRSVAAGSSTTYLTHVDCPVPDGFFGSAVVTADQPIVAIVDVNNRGIGSAGAHYQGTANVDAGTKISFPLVKHGHGGQVRTTTFYVQNASEFGNNMTAVFAMQDGNTYTRSYNNVPANAMVVISPADVGVPSGNGQVGSLTVTGTQPLAGSALEYEANVVVASNLQAYRAFAPADADVTLYCPLYRHEHAAKRQTTGVQVQNVSTTTAVVEMTFAAGGASYGPYVQNVAPGASATFYAPALSNPGIPKGVVGSVILESSADIVAVVNDSGTELGRNLAATYACFPEREALTRVNIPLAKEFFNGNTAGIQVQNVGSAPATLTFTYTDVKTGSKVVFRNTTPVPPGQSFTAFGIRNRPANITVISGNPAGLQTTVNSVVITADQPIFAIANESSYGPNPSLQDSRNYEGFNQ